MASPLACMCAGFTSRYAAGRRCAKQGPRVGYTGCKIGGWRHVCRHGATRLSGTVGLVRCAAHACSWQKATHAAGL